jgi:hypothetical protein
MQALELLFLMPQQETTMFIVFFNVQVLSNLLIISVNQSYKIERKKIKLKGTNNTLNIWQPCSGTKL